jgi:hypothetical protein
LAPSHGQTAPSTKAYGFRANSTAEARSLDRTELSIRENGKTGISSHMRKSWKLSPN